jgi:hypothetical protein
MFAIDCPVHGSKVLVGTRRIRSLVNTGRGILLDVECYCGTRVIAGTGRNRPPVPASAQPHDRAATHEPSVPPTGRPIPAPGGGGLDHQG